MRGQRIIRCRQSLQSIRSPTSSNYHPLSYRPVLSGSVRHDISRNFWRSYATPRRSPVENLDQVRIIDEAIASDLVHLVGASGGGLSQVEPLQQLLRNLNRDTQFLLQVAARSPAGYPIVKVVEKSSVKKQIPVASRPKKPSKTGIKSLELGWIIDDNDLAHRMRKFGEFLDQGKRVEVLLAQKRRKRKPTKEEAETLVRKIRECAASSEGAKEVLAMDGTIGTRLVLTFQGRKPPVKATNDETSEQD